MRQFLFAVFSILKQLARKRFMYFVVAVVILVIVADNYSEAHRNKILSQPEQVSEKVTELSTFDQEIQPSKTDSLVEFALSLKGIPYVYAGKSLKGFDCSGFTYYVYNKFDLEIPAGSANQYLIGEPVKIQDIQKGDLVFFTGTQRGDRSVGHVGIVISSESFEEVEFVHSSSGGGGRGVTVNSLNHPHYKARFLGARRLMDAS